MYAGGDRYGNRSTKMRNSIKIQKGTGVKDDKARKIAGGVQAAVKKRQVKVQLGTGFF